MTKAHVIIVDDNPTGLKVLAELLNLMDVSYTTLSDSTRLEATLDELEQVDAIFLDLEMPDIDGFSMLRILKEELQLTIPIIAYSVHTSEINVAREMGFDGFLGKPVDRQRFADLFERILNHELVWEIG